MKSFLHSTNFSYIAIFFVYSLPWIVTGEVDTGSEVAGLVLLFGFCSMLVVRNTPERSIASAWSQMRLHPVIFSVLIAWFIITATAISIINNSDPYKTFKAAWFFIVFGFSVLFPSLRMVKQQVNKDKTVL